MTLPMFTDAEIADMICEAEGLCSAVADPLAELLRLEAEIPGAPDAAARAEMVRELRAMIGIAP